MVAGRKKKAQKKRAVGGPTAMEVPDPRQSPLEVPEESLHGQPPPVGPRMEPSSALGVILQLLREISRDTKQLRAGQDSLLFEMTELRTSAGQMNQWLDLAESRFSSLEDTARETHQTSSIMSASQPDPMGVPTASSASFSSHQMILDATQAAASSGSASVYPGDAFSEPPPAPSPEQFRTASNSVVYSETEKKTYQVLATAWTQEMTSESEAAYIEAAESGQQEHTFSGDSLLIAPEYKTKPQLLTSTEEKAVQTFGALLSEEKISERQPAHTGAEEYDKQEDAFCGTSPREYKPEPRVLLRKLPETPQPPSSPEVQKEAPLTATQLSRRRPTNKRSGSSASASAVAPGHRVSSPPAEVVSPTKRPRASIAWRYFTKYPTSKFIATCDICGVNVKTGKIGSRVGTSTLLWHIQRTHHIVLKK